MNASVNEGISVNIMTFYDLVTVDRFPGGTGIFLFTTMSGPTLCPSQLAAQYLLPFGKLIGAWD